MPCPKCNGILIRDEGVIFCGDCLHTLNKKERDQYYGVEKTVETKQIPKEELPKKIQGRAILSKKAERKKVIVDTLSDSYIRRTIKTRNKRNPVEITSEAIENRRQKILEFRRKKKEKKILNKIDKLTIQMDTMYG